MVHIGGGARPFVELDRKYSNDHAQLTMVFQAVEFTLSAKPSDLPAFDGALTYGECVDTISNMATAGVQAYHDASRALPIGVARPFWDTMERLSASATLTHALVVEYFAHCPKYRLHLNDTGNVLVDGPFRGPTHLMEPLVLRELDLPPAAPLVDASTVFLAEYDLKATVLHGRVTVGNSDAAFFFKPRVYLREPDFDREVRVLTALHSMPDVPRSPYFAGCVTSKKGTTVLGLLVQWIDATKLADTSIEQRSMYIPKWRAQVRATLEVLHEHGVIWGDANAWNILIDRRGDAWVIDFDGGCRPDEELVPNEANAAIELRAVDRLFEAIALLGPDESQHLGRFD
ncbi:hypothetical protein LTR36_006702 [Oleoguttula mirabilis]|uniref:Protein kinase domain-containing protein n=1 Tax=Oleoguttula mirabilis TaxID=1507867 RepID=A0AAV9JCD0_9PEZI|nr:hypothetical protein LTR36_006702 [Oleoguttula mirabilis]